MKRLSLVLLLAAGATAPAATTLLNDTFTTETSRTSGQSLPTYTSWYATSPANLTLDTSAHDMTLKSGTVMMGSFESAGHVQSLGIGDSISLSLTFSLTGNTDAANALRFGLFNSGGTQISADSFAFSGAVNNPFTGYEAFLNTGTNPVNAPGSVLESRATSSNAAAQLFSGGYTSQFGSNGSAPNLTAATSYTMTLTVTRTTSTLDTIAFGLNGVTLSATDSTLALTSFDSVGVLLNAGTSITFSDINVAYTAAPEPGSAALLGAGIAVLAAFSLRRRGTSLA